MCLINDKYQQEGWEERERELKLELSEVFVHIGLDASHCRRWIQSSTLSLLLFFHLLFLSFVILQSLIFLLPLCSIPLVCRHSFTPYGWKSLPFSFINSFIGNSNNRICFSFIHFPRHTHTPINHNIFLILWRSPSSFLNSSDPKG